jgi:foldase protein PrsA
VTTKLRRVLAPLGAIVLVPLAIAGCGGGGVPGNAVVNIGGDTIKRTTFDHWMQIAATGNAQQQGQTGKAAIPDAPGFKTCIAQKKKTAPKPAKGQPTPTDATLKTQCEQEYNALRDSVMSFLVSAAWIQGEAHDRGVKYTDAQAKKEFDTQRDQSFPQEKDYVSFLKNSGYVQEDLLYRIRVQQLSQKLRDSVIKGKDKVTDAQVADYYNKNKSRYATPERRDLRIVLTKSSAKAEEAKKALQSGQDWKTVAAKYSIDQSSKANGGVLPAVARGQQEKSLDDAVFTATKGALQGPVKTQFGYYVFQVTKVTPASQQTLDQAKQNIKSLLVTEGQQKALDAFIKDFRTKWKDRTDCRSGFKTADCKGQPEPKTNTAAQGAQQSQTAPAQSGTSPATGG